MKLRKGIAGFALALWVSLTVQAGIAEATGPTDEANYPRMRSVEKLIEESSAARMIEGARFPTADEKRAKARELLEKARHLELEDGDAQRVDALLAEATQEMMAAVRMVKEITAQGTLSGRDFDALADSLAALLDAYVRIRSEEKPYEKKDELQHLVEEKSRMARLMRDEGRVDEGWELLDAAYSATKVAIEHLRGGETLIRTLHFESEEEEYIYELDRNDSLRMLIDVLLRDRIATNEPLANRVGVSVEKASSLRTQGELQADEQRFVEAIETLEASTTELVRAIRSAGIYIPQ